MSSPGSLDIHQQKGRRQAEGRPKQNEEVESSMAKILATQDVKPLRAVIYDRLSTAKQAVAGSTPKERRAALEQFSAEHGWQVVAVLFDAMSGSRSDRPDYQRLLAMCANKEVDVVVVARFDRLGRDGIERVIAETMIEEVGVRLVSASEGEADPNDPTRVLLRHVRAGVAEMEKLQIGCGSGIRRCCVGAGSSRVVDAAMGARLTSASARAKPA